MRFHPTDILCFYGTSWLSRIIRLATFGPSHVGMIVPWKSRNILFESTSVNTTPCLYRHELYSGSQFSEPWQIIGNAVKQGGYCEVWRVAEGEEPTDNDLEKIERLAFQLVQEGASYGLPGAVLSGTRIAKYWLPAERKHQLFCSAAVHRLLEVSGYVNRANSEFYSPAALLRMLKHEGTFRLVDTVTADNWRERAFGSYADAQQSGGEDVA